MPFNKKPIHGLPKPADDMGFGFELRKNSSKRENSSRTTAKENSVSRKSNPTPNDKLKSKNSVGPQHSDLKQNGKQVAEWNIQNREDAKKSATESDELVKHMSNLPGYLLHADRGEKFQEKAFSVGVLDWSRLEQWKNKQIPVPTTSNFTSFNSSESALRTASKSSNSVRSKENVLNNKMLLSSGIRSSHRDCLPESTKNPLWNVKRYESFKIETKSTGDEQTSTPLAFESFRKSHSDISLQKERGKDYHKRISQVGNFASNTRHLGVSHVPNENANGRDDGTKQNMEGLQEYNHKKKESNHKSNDHMGQPSVKPKHRVVSSKEMTFSSSGSSKKVDSLQEPDFDIGHTHCRSKSSNNVQLCHPEIRQSSCSENFQLSALRTSSDENFSESNRSSLSYVSFPDEVFPEDVCSGIPYSGALPYQVGHTSSETTQHRVSTDNKMSSMQSEDVSLGTKLRNQCVNSNLKQSLDLEIAELTAQRGMTSPSTNDRFRFSFSRIRRSFSFKEGPTLPQFNPMYNSAKPGPVTPQTSAPSKGKANKHNRARSSPLLRLLDPIFRHKPSSDIHQSAENSHTCKGSMNSISYKTNDVNESLYVGESKGSSVHGLLQLTIKNGLPLFKFVLNNERKIFAATSKSLASQEKEDLGCCFAFYLVNEVKKKSGGWMSHGSKEKSYGYAYNIIAQMKFSCSFTEPINQDVKKQCLVKEYVLSGVEVCQTGEGQPKFIQSRELAAIVIETPYDNLCDEGMHSDMNLLKKECLKCVAEEKCLCSSGEKGMAGSTTVILPGGAHGSPNKGEPSPLIHRWKTGGSCDCGGWDIGCKLLVLSNQKHQISKPYHDCFQLFVQEGAEQNMPLFTMLPLKDGFHSIEFKSTITPLQAFFISVVALNWQKLTGSAEMSSMLEEILKEQSSNNNIRLQEKAPIKYTPIPPPSPVGRV